MTEFKVTGYDDDGKVYTFLTCGAVILSQAIEQFEECVGEDFELLSGVKFERIEV